MNVAHRSLQRAGQDHALGGEARVFRGLTTPRTALVVWGVVVLGFAGLLPASVHVVRRWPTRVVVEYLDHAPGMDEVHQFIRFTRDGATGPRINEAGDVLFIAGFCEEPWYPGYMGTSGGGAWVVGPDDAWLVASTHTQVPGYPEGVMFGPSFSSWNSLGQVLGGVWRCDENGEPLQPNQMDLWMADRVEGFSQIVAEGLGPVPGLGPESTFSWFNGLTIGNHGIAFTGHAMGIGTGGYGLWAGRDGTLELVAIGGQPVPGFDPGFVFFWITTEYYGPYYNDAGQVPFSALITHDDYPSWLWGGVFRGDVDGVTLIAGHYHDMPGMPGTHLVIGEPDTYIDAAGNVLFRGVITGGGDDPFTDAVCFLHQDGELTILWRGGEQVTGLPEGVYWDTPTSPFMFTDDGDIYMVGWMQGPAVRDGANTYLLRRHAGGTEWQTLLVGGMPAPRVEAGVTLDGFYDAFFANNEGYFVFGAELEGPDLLSGQNDYAIYLGYPDGTIEMVLRGGDWLDVYGDGTKLCEMLHLKLAERESRFGKGESPFNDSNELVVGLMNWDGIDEGIYVLTLPEEPVCPSDLNGDTLVDQSDLGCLLAAYGTSPADPYHELQADINRDGSIDSLDLGILLAAYGRPCE